MIDSLEISQEINISGQLPYEERKKVEIKAQLGSAVKIELYSHFDESSADSSFTYNINNISQKLNNQTLVFGEIVHVPVSRKAQAVPSESHDGPSNSPSFSDVLYGPFSKYAMGYHP